MARGPFILVALVVALTGAAGFVPTASSTFECNHFLVTVGAVYMVWDHSPFDGSNGYSMWVYEETNGERGLQRGGVTMLGSEDVCQLSENPDRGVF